MHNSDGEQVPPISHSLQADMATGWKPKLKIIGPMPLNYDNPSVDRSIMALICQESAFYEVVYLGMRPMSSFKLHELVAKHYRYKYSYLLYNDFAHLKPFFKKFYSVFESQAKRPFLGMNPNITRKELIFDSCFQGGNLDCAVRLRANEYDLLLRVDSNTVGHVLWYYFRVTNAQSCPKRVRFNICNLRKNKSAYQRGMRPFVKREQQEWQQQGDGLEVSYQRLRYHKQNLVANLENNQHSTTFRKLTFELQFQPNQAIEVAYSIPYTYSQLLQNLKEFKKKAQALPSLQLQYDYEHESLSGLEIPIIKIRSGVAGSGKYCIFMIGRQHPGESNSSYVLKGTIEQLLSGEEPAISMLKHCDFVIIPMVNPDGVVAGNFRTSLFGKDLNRLFKSKDTTLLPEIEMTRTVFTQLYQQYRKKLLLFLDYHGHSTRKNAFLLGPGIIDAQLLTETRVLPKIIASYSDIFRYPSCCFRLEQNKRTTARALFGKLAGLAFTVQASNWAYYSSATKEVVYMQSSHFEQLGHQICRSIGEFIAGKMQHKNKLQAKDKEEIAKKTNFNKSKQDLAIRNSITSRQKTENIRKTTKEKRLHTETVIAEHQLQNKFYFNEQRPPSVAEVNSSDQMSDNGMDSESEGEDMQKDKFKKYIKAASQMLVEFEKIYYGDLYRKANSKYKLGQVNSKSKKLLFPRDKRKKAEHVQACLRPQMKPESAFKAEEKERQEKALRKRVFLEDTIFGKSGARSQNRVEKQEIMPNQVKKEGKRFKLMESQQKVKGKTNFFKDQLGLVEENTFQKLELNVEASLEARKKELSVQKMKFSPKSNVHIIFNREKEPSVGMGLLPMIRGSKTFAEQTQINSNNSLAPKCKDKFTDLLHSQQLLNKSAVVNVLKLSRVEKQKQSKNS